MREVALFSIMIEFFSASLDERIVGQRLNQLLCTLIPDSCLFFNPSLPDDLWNCIARIKKLVEEKKSICKLFLTFWVGPKKKGKHILINFFHLCLNISLVKDCITYLLYAQISTFIIYCLHFYVCHSIFYPTVTLSCLVFCLYTSAFQCISQILVDRLNFWAYFTLANIFWWVWHGLNDGTG